MKYFFLIIIIFFGCKQIKDETKNTENVQVKNKKLPAPVFKTNEYISVDYKKDKFNFSLNKNYQDFGNKIDWQWGYLSDKDGKIDSSGYDSFWTVDDTLYLKEQNCLNSIFIETYKNKMYSFKYAVLFDLVDSLIDTKKNILKVLSKNVESLKQGQIVNHILKNGEYKFDNEKYYEYFKLKIDTSLFGNHFEYKKGLKE